MVPSEAEKIINDYWKSFKNLGEQAIAQPISDLPCSPGKIRYAHFIYGEELAKHGLLTWDIISKLCNSYSEIHNRFAEDPKPINEQHKKLLEKLKKGVIDQDYNKLIIEKHKKLLGWEIEYHNFLVDCSKNYKNNK